MEMIKEYLPFIVPILFGVFGFLNYKGWGILTPEQRQKILDLLKGKP